VVAVERDTVWRYVESQRLDLADLLDGLSPEQWEHPSLCPGWTVRDVAAHVISSPQARLLATLGAFARHRGNLDRMILAEGKQFGRAAPGDIVAQYRRYAGSRKHPIGTTYWEPLLDVLVHGQDVAVPLGIPRTMPIPAAAAAATRVWSKAFPFRARRRLRGLRLEANDTDWSAGEGALLSGPIEAILVVLTGRPHGLGRLTGDGTAEAARRLGGQPDEDGDEPARRAAKPAV
jgi:uncharacterized protein (TIGR03083 family)